jgi:predicted MFS family arabinose efflux permease
MVVQWIALCIFIGYIAFSYVKRYPLNTRVLPIIALLIISLVLMFPIFPFSILTLLGLFLFEWLWILLALVLFIEMVISRNKRILMLVLGVISIMIYLYLRRVI